MKRTLFLILLIIILPILLVKQIIATPAQAYQDYLYQYDLYRQKYSDFRIAKSEYEKYKTLVSEKNALESAKSMLIQRNLLFNAYLSYINERLNAGEGLTDAQKRMYQTFIRNEETTLTAQNQAIPSLAALNDVTKASQEFDNRYLTIQKTLRQAIVSLSLGSLSTQQIQYDQALQDIKLFLINHASDYSAERRATFERWLIQSTAKEDIFKQKYDETTSQNNAITARSLQELDTIFNKLQTEVKQANQYLNEAISALDEIVKTLPYTE